MDGAVWIYAGGVAAFGLGLWALVRRLGAPSRAARRSAAAHLEPGETLLRAGPARRVEGLRTPTGQLYLTRRRLVFAPDGAASAQGSPAANAAIELAEVRSVETFMGVGVLPNGVCLAVAGSEHRFLVPANSHGAWTRAIASARASAAAR